MNSGTHLYPESTTLMTEIETTGVQLKPGTYIEWSIALKRHNQAEVIKKSVFLFCLPK